MSSFSQRHAPPPRALGPEIPAGVRQAIASWFREHDVDSADVRRRFFQRRGYGNVDHVASDVADRWGEDAGVALYERLNEDPDVDQWNHGRRRQAVATTVVYLYMPEPLYLDYLEEAVGKYADDRMYVEPEYAGYAEDPYVAPVRYLNDLFASRRIDYRFNADGRAEWHGDEGAYVEVVRPALDALDDARLAGCRQEFEASRGHLRVGTPKDREDAIEEAGKAVESAMKVLLDARGIARPARETAEPLWIALRDGGVVPTPTREAILAPSRLRNEYGGHGQGGEIRAIPDGVPELAVRSAAAAIGYLASRLP